MKIFLDTADIYEIKRFARIGVIDGVTTNPAILAKDNKDFLKVVKEITEIIDGPISGEVVSLDVNGMVKEAKALASIHENIVVKLPANHEGFEALRKVSDLGIKTNLTLVYTANQALIAAKNGATYVSPFVGRLEANAGHGSLLISEIVKIFNNYSFDTQIIAASMRTSVYVKEAALAGAHIATVPPNVLDDVMNSELSDLALKGFLEEWDKLATDKKNIFENIKNI